MKGHNTLCPFICSALLPDALIFAEATLLRQPTRKLEPTLVDYTLEVFSVKLVALAQHRKTLGFFAAKAA
jgi:hypothetical protein